MTPPPDPAPPSGPAGGLTPAGRAALPGDLTSCAPDALAGGLAPADPGVPLPDLTPTAPGTAGPGTLAHTDRPDAAPAGTAPTAADVAAPDPTVTDGLSRGLTPLPGGTPPAPDPLAGPGTGIGTGAGTGADTDAAALLTAPPDTTSDPVATPGPAGVPDRVAAPGPVGVPGPVGASGPATHAPAGTDGTEVTGSTGGTGGTDVTAGTGGTEVAGATGGATDAGGTGGAGGPDRAGPSTAAGHRAGEAPRPPAVTGRTGGARPGGGDTAGPAPARTPRPAGADAPGAVRRRHGRRRAGAARSGERRVAGMLLGLAAGDAAGWPAARHRAARMPEWTRRLTRELDTFAEQNATTTLPVPIALNQPPDPLRLGPSDDAEWAAWTAQALLRAGDDALLADLERDRRIRAAVDLAWSAVADEVAEAERAAPEAESAAIPLRARISVRAGLGNLATGLRPPATGHDNPHYFDDAACVRACVLAVAHPGDPRRAAELAEFDARYSQDGDGVHGARAMAAAVSLALAGAAVDACVDAALAELPDASEAGRNARHALHLARESAPEGAFALVPLLEHQIVDHVYSYGIAAAETVPVALALALASGGRFSEAVPAAACLSRVADSTPALTGALTGALGGLGAVPDPWRQACRSLSGCVLPRLAGTDLVELAERLEAGRPSTGGG